MFYLTKPFRTTLPVISPLHCGDLVENIYPSWEPVYYIY